MSYRMEALQRNVIGVVASFTNCPRPAHQGLSQAVADFLLLLIQDLLGHLFPEKMQIPQSGNHSKTNCFARREKQRSLVVEVVVPVQELLRRLMSQVAGGKYMRECGPCLARDATAFRKMRFNKTSMFPG